MRERFLYRLFETTIIVKGCIAFADILGAGMLHFFGASPFTKIVITLALGELSEDPSDFLARFFIQAAHQFSPDITTLTVLYLLAHGIINLVFVVGLWHDAKWAYPFAIGSLCMFMAYQFFRLSLFFSSWLIILVIFDILTIWLIWHEYRQRNDRSFSNRSMFRVI